MKKFNGKCDCGSYSFFFVEEYLGEEGRRIIAFSKLDKELKLADSAKWDEVISVKKQWAECEGCARQYSVKGLEVRF